MSGSAISRTAEFMAGYAPLREGSPELGEIASLPWDAEIFGFGVADYRPGGMRPVMEKPEGLAAAVASWTESRSVDLVGCRVPARPRAAGAILEVAGFRFIEVQLRATLPRLRATDFGPTRVTVRAAVASDRARIADIASSAFTLGRYHADPRFPRALADKRYRIWMERACMNESPDRWIGVIGPPGSPIGFLQAEIDGTVADIRLAAVERSAGGIAGPELFRGTMHELARRGIARVTARISAVNTAVWNIYASLGFRFHEPELVYHWHRPGAPGLRSLAQSLDEDEADEQERNR